jgi:hypothetical protein
MKASAVHHVFYNPVREELGSIELMMDVRYAEGSCRQRPHVERGVVEVTRPKASKLLAADPARQLLAAGCETKVCLPKPGA